MKDDDDKKKKLREILAASVPKEDNVHQLFPNKKPKMSIVGNENHQSAGGQILGDMSIVGNKNTQVAGDMVQHHHHHKAVRLTVAPALNSIGADALLKNGIMARFNELGERREKRFGKSAYGVMYRNFKKSFDIKSGAWTAIWTWPMACAPAIIKYLEEKLANTIEGRIEGAANKADYIHTRPYLYKLEKEALEHLDIDKDFVENSLQMLFGASSHRDLTHLQQWQWVCHLEGLVRQQYEEN